MLSRSAFEQLARDVALYRRASKNAEALGYPRNPWTGIHAGHEFLYDVRHPLLFGRRVLAGLRGQIPQVGGPQRVLAVALMTVGALNVLAGMAIVVRGVGWL